jgi:hypothetical protein
MGKDILVDAGTASRSSPGIDPFRVARLLTGRSCYLRGMTLRACKAHLAFSLLALVAMSGCASVAPYERGRLAHRTMTTSDLASPAEAHARAIHEGATGGGFEAGGGCGCN